MKNFRMRTLLVVLACLLVILGCDIPGLAPASAPAPTVDTVLLVTMVAETVAAARTATANAVTPVPTSAPMLASTPTESFTPTVQSSASGSLLTKRDDGSALFSDQLADYEVIIPVGWLPMRLNEQEFTDASTSAETADPAIQSALKSVEAEDPNKLRLFVIDTQEGHVQGSLATTIQFQWDQQNDMSLLDEADLLAASEALPTENPGLEVVTTELRRTSLGIPIGVITSRTPTLRSDGSVLVIFEERVFVDLPQGTLTILLTTTEDFKDTVLPGFDAILETLAINS